MTNQTNAESRRSKTDKMKDKVDDAKETVQDTASHIAAEAREKTSHLTEEGREKVHELGDKAERMARSRADEQKERVTNGIRTFADALRRGCDDLSADQNQYRPLLNSAADRVEGVSRYLEQRDVDALTSDVRRFAREHTPLFLGSAFAIGFASARFLKSSPDHVRQDSLEYGRQNQDRFDRMLPESGTTGTSSFEGRTGSLEGRTGSNEAGSSAGGLGTTAGRPGSTGGTGSTGTAGGTTGGRSGTGSFSDGGSTRGGGYE